VFPADLVSRFEETKEQKMATEIFAVQLPTENGADMEKAINEQVRLLKRTKIDHLTATAATVEDIQRMVEARKKLESLYITI
jgi:DNA primase